MGHSPDRDDENDVELHPDEPSFITGAVRSPMENDEQTDRVRLPSGIPRDRDDETAPVQLPRDETTARAVKPPLAPADGEMQTLQVAPNDNATRPRTASVPEIATASGLTHGPRSSRVGPSTELLPDLRPPDEWDDGSNASLVTPRFAAGALVNAELAFADTAGPNDASTRLPADHEPDTTQLGGNPGARIGAGAEGEDRTMPKASVDAALQHAREDATLEPPRDRAENELSPKLPPMRPRLDSEAAGHWPSGFAETDEARAALLHNVVSPVSSDTAAMPRPVVDDPLHALRSQIEASLAKTEHAIAVPLYTPPSSPRIPDSAPGMAATPAFPSSSGVRVDRTRESNPSNQASPTSRGGLGAPRARSLSPIVVFFATFVIVGGLLGGVVAVQQHGWFGPFRSKTPAPVPSPSPTPATSASTPEAASGSPAASISTNPSASASSPAPASSPGTRRTRPRPRTRHP